MRQDSTTPTATPQANARPQAAWLREASWLLAVALAGAVLIGLAYQVPATHAVDIGGYDAAYTQGFYDPSRSDSTPLPAYLSGSNGQARWTKAASFLLFPQIGLPAELTLRLRGLQRQPVAILLNGSIPLDTITPTLDWQTYRFRVEGGLTKPSDVVIELRSTATTQLSQQDTRQVGVLLDRAEFQTVAWPITPYPVPLLLGGCASSLLALIVRRGPRLHWQRWALGMLILTTAFLGLYRLPPPYPYPLRALLLTVNVALTAVVGLRYGPAVLRQMPRLLDLAAIGAATAWFIATLIQAQQHLVLSLPGVENDFRVFALRSAHLVGTFQSSGVYDRANDGVLRADGFYNLGYPLLLWLTRPFNADNPFLAARFVAACSGALLLAATWWLARRLLGPAGALLALGCLALSPLAASYGLYLGSDMPFAAACMLALALLFHANYQRSAEPARLTSTLLLFAAAGLAAGLAFLLRHPGLLLLPFGWLAIGLAGESQQPGATSPTLQRRERAEIMQPLLVFSIAFVVAILPQLFVNLRDTGNPLFSQQAKNIWLAVYANSDWSQSNDVPNSISLSELVLRDPARFFGNWTTNLRGFLGAGAEDVSEFGRADQLRLLAFPANWLAVAALAAWLLSCVGAGGWGLGAGGRSLRLLVAWVGLYVLGVSVGLSLVRFALPLMPVYAIAASWAVLWLAQHSEARSHRWSLLVGRVLPLLALVLALWLANGFAIGSGVMLRNQNADALAAVQLVQATLAPGEMLHMELPPRVLFDSYSAIAHRVAQPNAPAAFVLRQAGAAAQPGEQVVGRAGGYTLLRRQ